MFFFRNKNITTEIKTKDFFFLKILIKNYFGFEMYLAFFKDNIFLSFLFNCKNFDQNAVILKK